MPNRKQIIIISVLGLLALMLGYWTGSLTRGQVSGAESVKPVADNNTAKTVRKLTAEEEKVVGEYIKIVEALLSGGGLSSYKIVLLDNGVAEFYSETIRHANSIKNGKNTEIGKWYIVDEELHVVLGGKVKTYKVKPNGNLEGGYSKHSN